MKVPTQKSRAVGVHPPSSTTDSSGTPCPTHLSRVCQLHVEQLGAQLPVVAAWIVYQDSDTKERQSIAFYNQEQNCFHLDLFSYLESEVGLIDSLPVLILTEVALVEHMLAALRPKGSSCLAPGVVKSARGRERCHSSGKILASGCSLSSHSTYLSCELQTQEEYKDTDLTGLFAYVCVLSQHSDPCHSDHLTMREYLLLCTKSSLSLEQRQYAEQHAQLLNNYLCVLRESSRQRSEIQLLEQVVQRAEHQLRNPLALIGLYAENLCQGLPAGAFQEQAIIIRETVSDLSANLTGLVYCGQQAKMHVAPYDLGMILAESIRGVQPWLEQKQLYLSCPDTPCICAVDSWQIKQVFDNLLSNAVHFSPQGGAVTCNWQVFAVEVLVEVRDQGPGLSEKDLKQAFTPFYSRRPGGTGLGLAIAKKIVLDHRGSLWAQNLPTGGAQFSFTLPRK